MLPNGSQAQVGSLCSPVSSLTPTPTPSLSHLGWTMEEGGLRNSSGYKETQDTGC